MKENFIKLKYEVAKIFEERKKLLSIILIALIILIIGTITICNYKKQIVPNRNLYNMGFVEKKGNSIYYLGFDEGSLDGIYKVKGNSKKTQKVTSEYGYYLNIYDNYIYFVDYKTYDIIKIKTNGKDKQTIVENIDVDPITVVDGWIYYSKDADFYKIKTNGKDEQKILDKLIYSYQIDDNWIYYTYNSDGEYVLAKIKTNGDERDILEKEAGKEFFIKDNFIYYIYKEYNYDEGKYFYDLYKIKTNGKSKEKVGSLSEKVDINSINIKDNLIYFVKTDDEGNDAIYSMKLNCKDEKKIIDIKGYSTSINIIDNWIYYTDSNDNENITMFRVKLNGKDKQEL